MNREKKILIMGMDKRSNINKAVIEIVDTLSKYEIKIGDVDLVFNSVESIVNQETKIHISPEVFNTKY